MNTYIYMQIHAFTSEKWGVHTLCTPVHTVHTVPPVHTECTSVKRLSSTQNHGF